MGIDTNVMWLGFWYMALIDITLVVPVQILLMIIRRAQTTDDDSK